MVPGATASSERTRGTFSLKNTWLGTFPKKRDENKVLLLKYKPMFFASCVRQAGVVEAS